MFYSQPRFIKAHENRNSPYYNHSYDREVRNAFCSECGQTIGKQDKYPDFDRKFYFYAEPEKNDYTHCPYCGHKFNEEK